MMSTTLALLLLFLACIALSVHMTRHAKGVLGFQPSPQKLRWLGNSGWVLLLCSAIAPINNYGASIGVLTWFGLFTLTAVSIALLQSYKPQSLRYFALLAIAFSVILFIWNLFSY